MNYKIMLITFFIIFIGEVVAQTNWPTGGPELYITVTDNETVAYKIFAIKGDNSPIYNINYDYTVEYDTAFDSFIAEANTETQNEGFDWIAASGSIDDTTHDDLGYGFYKIFVMRNYNTTDADTVTWFYMDYRMEKGRIINSPDIEIRIDRFSDGTYSIMNSYFLADSSGEKFKNLTKGDSILIWENNWEQEKDWSIFTENIPVTNDINGSSNPTIGTILLEKNEGFPEIDYPINHIFPADSNVAFWKEGTYKFEAESEIIDNYRVRNWINNDYGNIANVKLETNYNRVVYFFQPTHPLTVNNYLEGGSAGTYDVHWQAAGTTETGINSGVSYDAFEFNDDNSDIYNLIVSSDLNTLGTDWTFLEWDDGTTNTTLSNIAISAPTIKTAYYKGNMRSDDANAYSNSGQRKVLRLSNGSIYMVYESMGKVWIEADYANGQHIVELLDEGRSPSLALDYTQGNDDYFYLVYDRKISENISEVAIQHWKADALQSGYTVKTVNHGTNFDLQPALIKNNGSRLLVVWREDGNGNAGLNYSYISHSGGYSQISTGVVPNTDQFSTKPSLVIAKINSNLNKTPIHLAWQQSNSQIRYYQLNQQSGITVTDYKIVSSGSGYNLNYNPSITLELYQGNYYPQVSWVGSTASIIGFDGDVDKSPVYRRTLKRGKNGGTSWGFFYAMGDDVTYQNSNRADDNNYVTAWTEQTGGTIENKFIKNREWNSIHSLGTNDQYLQLTNGANLNEMIAVTFNVSSLPYVFDKSAAIGSLPKENVLAISSGRQGVAYIDTAEFYFAFGDVELNGSPVEFEEIVDSNYVNDLAHINQYLRTKPFTLSGGDALTYSVLYGLTDSLFSTQILGEDNFVYFKVELIAENTNEVLGLYDDITYDLNNLNLYDNIAYSINTDGIGTKTVRLRLVVEDNLGGGYGFSKIFAKGSALGKNRSFLEVPYQGSLKVEKYALLQNYPNPFNPTTTIKYEIPETGFVTLRIYDILGREVTTLVNAKQEAGRYEAKFNANGLSSGIYIYRIQAGKFTESKKMILLK